MGNVLVGILFLVNVLLLFGISKKKPAVLLIWLIINLLILSIFTPVSIFIIGSSLGDVVLTKSRIWGNYGNYVVLPIVNTLAYYFWSTIWMAYMKLKKENRTSVLPTSGDMNHQQFITEARPSFRRTMSLPAY